MPDFLVRVTLPKSQVSLSVSSKRKVLASYTFHTMPRHSVLQTSLSYIEYVLREKEYHWVRKGRCVCAEGLCQTRGGVFFDGEQPLLERGDPPPPPPSKHPMGNQAANLLCTPEPMKCYAVIHYSAKISLGRCPFFGFIIVGSDSSSGSQNCWATMPKGEWLKKKPKCLLLSTAFRIFLTKMSELLWMNEKEYGEWRRESC